MTEEFPVVPDYRIQGNSGELCSRIRIQATPGRIWEVLAAFSDYPAWNPFIRHISGTLAAGETITVHIRPAGTPGMTIHPVVVSVDPARELRWEGHLFLRGLFEAEHTFAIRPLDNHASLFVQRERFSGLLLPFFSATLKDGTARGISAMNAALRARAEQPAGAAP
jgi:hypothetical protein